MANERARYLRRHMTSPELALWREVRQLRKTGFVIRRHSPFGDYIVDFISHRERLVIEIDGGKHDARRQCDQDCTERTRYIEARGYTVTRFDSGDVQYRTNEVVNRIKQILVERRAAKLSEPSNQQRVAIQ